MKETDSNILTELIRQLYSNATPASESILKLYEIIAAKLDIQPEQILHADSICCDEVNAIQYPAIASKMPGPFKIGGLSGYPFAGFTALNTVAQHVPENGALLFSYGPHIGVNSKGIAGKLRRTGQSDDSICCGAIISSLQQLQSNTLVAGTHSEDDYQINFVQQTLFHASQRIQQSSDPIIEATEIMYETIDVKMQHFIQACDFLPRHVFILGMVLINTDADYEAHYQVRRLEHFDTQLQLKTNWLEFFQAKTL